MGFNEGFTLTKVHATTLPSEETEVKLRLLSKSSFCQATLNRKLNKNKKINRNLPFCFILVICHAIMVDKWKEVKYEEKKVSCALFSASWLKINNHSRPSLQEWQEFIINYLSCL